MYKVRLRGELCIGIGSLLSLAAFILLIFVHVGSTSTSSTPRGIAMARMNVSNYGAALAIGIAPDPVDNLYALNASAPLARAQGIRTTYNFGLYTYCGILSRPNTTNLPISNISTIPLPDTGVGMCGNTSAAFRFAPYDVLVADMSGPFPVLTDSLVNATLPFRDSKSLGGQTRSAYYLIIIGTVLCFLSLILGLIKRTSTFLISAFLATLSAIFTLAAACLWLSAIHAAQSVNSLVLGGTTPLGIVVSSGEGLTLLWAAFGCLVAALVPYWISSCTFRG